MRERPILFSTPMVKAIIDGRKTMTRRIVKAHNHNLVSLSSNEEFRNSSPYPLAEDKSGRCFYFRTDETIIGIPCPYRIGMKLWVRETFHIVPPNMIFYKTDSENKAKTGWKPSIFMPRWASRITLEITNIRVERLQEITEEDALREGVEIVGGDASCCPYKNYLLGKPNEMKMHCSCATRSFQTLWDSINGKTYPWSSNPWVWVIEFKKLEAV